MQAASCKSQVCKSCVKQSSFAAAKSSKSNQTAILAKEPKEYGRIKWLTHKSKVPK